MQVKRGELSQESSLHTQQQRAEVEPGFQVPFCWLGGWWADLQGLEGGKAALLGLALLPHNHTHPEQDGDQFPTRFIPSKGLRRRLKAFCNHSHPLHISNSTKTTSNGRTLAFSFCVLALTMMKFGQASYWFPNAMQKQDLFANI